MDRHGFTRLLLLWALLLAGCKRQASAVPDDSLITGSPCSPPCWQGLTPGQTSVAEAMQFLEDNPLVNGNVDVGGLSDVNEAGSGVAWWWADEKHDYSKVNVFEFDPSNNLMSIRIFEPNTEISIEQVIATYGPPTVINMAIVPGGEYFDVPPSGGIGLAAIYTGRAFLITWKQRVKVEQTPVKFCPSLGIPILTIEYYTPELAQHYESELWTYELRALAVGGNALFEIVDGKVQVKCVVIR